MKKYLSVFLLACLVITSSLIYAPVAHADSYIESLGLVVEKGKKAGLLIEEVTEDSLLRGPDQNLGNDIVVRGDMAMKPGDIIIALGDEEVKSRTGLQNAWANCKLGSEVEFRFFRDGRESSVTVKKSKDVIGIAIIETAIGVPVVSVKIPTVTEETGILEGDLIVGLNEETVRKPEDLVDTLKNCSTKEQTRIDYIHDGQKRTRMITLLDYDFRICELKNEAYGIKAGVSIELISVKATGNLSLKKSFHWMWRNSDKDKWKEVSNDSDTAVILGLRTENSLDENTGLYTSTLWADNIKKSATGSIYLMITDKGGMTVSSGEMTLKVK